jgi:hypothetical protein
MSDLDASWIDDARAFIEAAEWVFAKSYAAFAPHEWTSRRSAIERGISRQFTEFCRTISEQGYSRPWGRNLWPSLDLGEDTFWLYHEWFEPEQRTVINRWKTAELGTGPGRRAPAQMALFAEDQR